MYDHTIECDTDVDTMFRAFGLDRSRIHDRVRPYATTRWCSLFPAYVVGLSQCLLDHSDARQEAMDYHCVPAHIRSDLFCIVLLTVSRTFHVALEQGRVTPNAYQWHQRCLLAECLLAEASGAPPAYMRPVGWGARRRTVCLFVAPLPWLYP